MATFANPYPPIADYAMISDCHCVALISRTGSIDWCCMPRIDDDSCFGRLLDWEKGGFCSIAPKDPDYSATRRYLPGTMILETRFCTQHGEVLLYDFFAIDAEPVEHPRFDLIRIVEGVQGEVELETTICPRFDYGEIIPRLQQRQDAGYTAIGSNKGLIIHADIPFNVIEYRDMTASCRLKAGQRVRLMMQFQFPEQIEATIEKGLPDPTQIDGYLEATRNFWKEWSSRIRSPFELDFQTLRSTITLKALTFEKTGAIAAAATTSLPESIGGERNWDYRFSWVRDSVFTVRALHELGYEREADRFHKFIERSSAGSAEEMQIMYGVDGKRRLTEIELDWLEGYQKSKPVRIGNAAAKQMQLDIYGELLEMAWQWFASGHPTDPNYWTFLEDVLNTVCEHWQDRDHGIWEMRGTPAHFVHSKVMCWAALNRGIMLAKGNGFAAPIEQWSKHCAEIRLAIESRGVDPQRGIFVQSFGSPYLDAALLLLPRVGFVAYDDPRMIRTVDMICSELDYEGLLLRYNSPDNLPGYEGVFLPCTFWLVNCLAHQGRREQAWQYYERALSCANDVGLFSEEFDVENWEMLGNFPQALTHVSQIMARLALDKLE